MKKLLNTLLITVLAGLFMSCYRSEDFKLDKKVKNGIPYDLALPVANARLTMDNFVDVMGGKFEPGEDGLLYWVYTMAPVKFSYTENIELPGGVSLNENGNAVTYYGDTLIEYADSRRYSLFTSGLPAGFSIKEIEISSARFRCSLTNMFNSPLSAVVTFPNVVYTDSRQPVSFQINVEAGVTENMEAEVNGISVLSELGTAYIDKSVRVNVDMRGGIRDTLPHLGSYRMSGIFGEMVFLRATGTVAKNSFSRRSNMSVAGLGKEKIKRLTFQDAVIETESVVQGFSAPVRVEENSMSLNRFNDNPASYFTVYSGTFDLPYPQPDDKPLYATHTQSVNILPLLIDNPKEVNFYIRGSYNPDGESDPSPLHVVEPNASVVFNTTCRVPLWFSADNYPLEDTVVVDFDQMKEDIVVNRMVLKTIIENAFPLEFDMDAVFLNRQYDTVFTLFRGRHIEAAPVSGDSAMHVNGSIYTQYEDELADWQAALIENAAYMRISARLSSPENKTVKIYEPTENEGFLRVLTGFRSKIGIKID